MNNKSFSTSYGIIDQPLFYELYPNNKLKSCVLNKKIEISCSYGSFIPQYEDAGIRRKNSGSLSFYESGMLKSISLQEQIKVPTIYGDMPAEYLTFYDTGEIKRIFPLNGKLSAYWDEDDEKELAETLSIDLTYGSLRNKLISMHLYKTGNLKSVTLWPKEKAKLLTSQGILPVRIGFSLYENGNVKSLEPQFPLDIVTPIGKLKAYNNTVHGLNGDLNSLCFYENGKIKALTSTSNRIKILYNKSLVYSIEPTLEPSILGEETFEIVPILIEFIDDRVIFNKDISLEIGKYSFSIERCTFNIKNSCSSCSSCGGCQ